MDQVTFRTMYKAEYPRECEEYPESRVVLDPTCTLEQILNRAAYGMSIPQRDVSGDITQAELDVLGISANEIVTLNRMQLIDLRMKAQMRINAAQAKRLKIEQAEKEKALRQGIIDEYIAQQKANAQAQPA